MKKEYSVFYLEIALKDPSDTNVYAFENLSHIPTKKLIEIFGIDLKKDPYIIEGYFLTKTNYKRHKKYIKENMVALNLDIFEYSLMRYGISNKKDLRKFYKETLME